MTTIATGKLTKKDREAIPEEHFAVPGKRKLPINDERHTRLAWDMVDRTQGLTQEERSTARSRILKRAKQLGIDTKDWHKVKSMAISAMSLNIAHDDDHPNKMPFGGVLTKLDEPSDYAPGGANGRRIIVTADAARAALRSLLGMAVDFTPHFDGHDAQAKIGIITSADVVGNEIKIEGFIYAADFPETAELIQALKDVLGFSFEAQRLVIEDPSADILRITELTFTGAAILRKDKAAYTTTSLAASAAQEFDMDAEELKKILAEANAPLLERITTLETQNQSLVKDLQANAAVRSSVEPHCSALEGCAAAMEAAGIGAEPKSGHAAVLRRMASSMRAEAAIGKIPHIFRDHDYPYYAGADKTVDPDKVVADKIAAAVEAAVKPLKDQLAAAETKVKDLTEVRRVQATAPERKTLSASATAALSRIGLTVPEGDKKLAVGEVDKLATGANLNLTQKIALKNELDRAGMLA